jgi:hypothetical protein
MKVWFLALPFLVTTAQAETLTGRVVSVADGDIITILDNTNTQYKIRLAGIDAQKKISHLATYLMCSYFAIRFTLMVPQLHRSCSDEPLLGVT